VLRKARSKLRGRARKLASKYIAEEMRTKKYPRKQSIAIGISRAKTKIKQERLQGDLRSLARKYGVKA
jgi:hypothetical protein